MNFSRLAPSPPFPAPHFPGTVPGLGITAGDSTGLFPHPQIQSCLRERVFVHGQLSCLRRKSSALPGKSSQLFLRHSQRGEDGLRLCSRELSAASFPQHDF